MSKGQYYEQVIQWNKEYGSSGASDQRAIQTFMDCETDEKIRALRGQLYSISTGKFDAATLDKQLGAGRASKHGSYEQWAKLMLMWMAGYKA